MTKVMKHIDEELKNIMYIQNLSRFNNEAENVDYFDAEAMRIQSGIVAIYLALNIFVGVKQHKHTIAFQLFSVCFL